MQSEHAQAEFSKLKTDSLSILVFKENKTKKICDSDNIFFGAIYKKRKKILLIEDSLINIYIFLL